MGSLKHGVIDWPSAELSIKRCTCVNKRMNSGFGWSLNNNITRRQTVWVSRGQDASVRASGRQKALGPQWPTVEQPSQDAKEVLLWSEELWVNIAVCPCLQLIYHNNLTLSRIKCERYIFIKKCVRSFIEVRHYVSLSYAYISIHVVYYATIGLEISPSNTVASST